MNPSDLTLGNLLPEVDNKSSPTSASTLNPFKLPFSSTSTAATEDHSVTIVDDYSQPVPTPHTTIIEESHSTIDFSEFSLDDPAVDGRIWVAFFLLSFSAWVNFPSDSNLLAYDVLGLDEEAEGFRELEEFILEGLE